MKLTLIGSRYNEELLEHTKKSLSDTLSPVKKTSIARSFLTRFLGASNEHSLDEFIKETAPVERIPECGYIVSLKDYEFNETGTGYVLTATESVICISLEAAEAAQAEYFRSAFPDHDGVTDSVVESSTVQDYLDSKFECPFDASDELEQELEQQKESLEQELYEMTADEIMEWLLDNFGIDELTNDSFFKDHLCAGLNEISVDSTEIRL